MREIKFRAWHKTLLIMIPFEEIYAEFQTVRPVMLKEIIEYEKYELMQYTGLKDKNGKEIYEGDIVKYPGIFDSKFDANYVVEFLYGGFWYAGDYLFTMLEFNLEVIGNIYENPELLNERK